MSEVLARALRPRRLSEMVGQERLANRIKAQVKERMPNVWLLQGESGGGKTTLARILALSMQLPRERFGEPTEEDWARFSDYNIHEINAAKINKVEDMREQTDLARHHPVNGKVRVFLLDECHKLTTAAQDLLLKATEDAPKHIAWIFGTTDPGKLLPTLVRRCTSYRMYPLDEETMLKLLIRAKKAAKSDKPVKELASKLSEMGVTSAGFALVAAEHYFSGASIMEAVTGTSASGSGVQSLELCRAFVAGDWSGLRSELVKATASDARGIRLMLLSYLRSVLVKNSVSPKANKVAEAILALSAYPPPEDPAFLAWFAAVLQLQSQKLK